MVIKETSENMLDLEYSHSFRDEVRADLFQNMPEEWLVADQSACQHELLVELLLPDSMVFPSRLILLYNYLVFNPSVKLCDV